MSSLIRADAASRFVPISNREINFKQQQTKNQANEDHDLGEGVYSKHTGSDTARRTQGGRTIVANIVGKMGKDT